MPQVEELILNITGGTGKLSDISLINFSKCLPSLTKLNRLELVCFGNADITDKGTTELLSAIGKLTQLSSLKFHFIHCKLPTNQTIIELGKEIFKLNQLKSLSVEASSYNYTDPGFCTLMENLRSNTHISSLRLGFSHGGVADAGITELSGTLIRLRHLRNLSLSFLKCDFSEESFKKLEKSVKSSKKLQTINPYFEVNSRSCSLKETLNVSK